jgi:sterol desaturase/sphingolipid hydroxylase (fatty acid hydroxylase superfamily)
VRSPTVLSLAVGLLVLSAGFWLLERWRPSIPGQKRSKNETLTDLAYWFFTPLVTRFVTRLSLALVFALMAVWQGVTFEELRQAVTTRHSWASSLSAVVQIPLILLLADLLAYWSHRLFHGRWLWPFHAIHHSSTTVDWLSSVRLHPVNDVVSRVVQVLPLYWLGFNGVVLAAFVPFLTLYALLLHAKLDLWSAALRDCQPGVPSLASHVGGGKARQEFCGIVSVHRSRVRHVLHAARSPATALRHARQQRSERPARSVGVSISAETLIQAERRSL